VKPRNLRTALKHWARQTLLGYAPPEMRLALRQLRHRTRHRLGRPETSPFPPRNFTVARGVEPARVLVLAPHPDDEIIGPGGALAMHLAAGSEVTVLYLTDGRGPNVHNTDLVAVRRREAESIGQEYGFEQVFWDVPDNHLAADEAAVARLAAILARLQPGFVFVPSFFDHQYDHFAANQVLAGALRQISGTEAIILGYEVWDNMPFPNFIVDISSHFQTKADMLAQYAVPNEFTDFIQLCRHRNGLHYLLYVDSLRRQPEGYAEAFYRLDASSYPAALDEYQALLAENKSPLMRAGQPAPKL